MPTKRKSAAKKKGPKGQVKSSWQESKDNKKARHREEDSSSESVATG